MRAAKTPAKCRKPQVYDFQRRNAVAALKDGIPADVIARILGVTTRSLYRWRQLFLGGSDLSFHPRTGRPRKLSNVQLECLRELLSRGAAAHGWHNDLWTTRRVVEVIRREFNVGFSQSQGYRVLTDYLGWSPQCPITQLRERDNSQIEKWKTDAFPRILKMVARRDASLVFIDESGFLLAPTLRRTFAPRGSRPVVKVSDPHGRISAIAAITIDPTRSRLGVLYHLLPDNENFNSYRVVRFVSEVCGKISGPLVVVWDSIPIHGSQLMDAFLEKTPQLSVEQFPPYAPELNPVDKVWAYLKYGRLANYTPTSIPELRARLVAEMAKLKGRQKVLFWCVREAGLGSVFPLDASHPVAQITEFSQTSPPAPRP